METVSAIDDGHGKAIAAAQHRVKSLASSHNAPDDMIQILSAGFDCTISSVVDLLSPGSHSSFSSNLAAAAVDAPYSASSDAPSSAAAEAANGVEAPEKEAEKAAVRFEAAEREILDWDGTAGVLLEASGDDIARYLAAVDESIQAASAAWVRCDCRPAVVVQLAMARLEDEFGHHMRRHAIRLDASGLCCVLPRPSMDPMEDFENSTEFDPMTPTASAAAAAACRDDTGPIELVRTEAIVDLAVIAGHMVAAGYADELIQAYCNVRREVLNENLALLGIDIPGIDEVQHVEWRLLDDMMRRWIQGFNTVFRSVFPGERRLCNAILSAITAELRDECFLDIAKGCVGHLLNFGNAVSITPRLPEKLFQTLNMYEALGGAMSEVHELFPGLSGELVRWEAESVLQKLGEFVKGTISGFADVLRQEASQGTTQAGEIHPVTRYLMNYLRLFSAYSETLDRLLDGVAVEGVVANEDLLDCTNEQGMSPTRRWILILVSCLEDNIERKSKLYSDEALGCIFLMNNTLYLINKVRDTELARFLADSWVRSRRTKIRQYSKLYLRSAWKDALSHLTYDGYVNGGSTSNGTSKNVLKEKFKNFNLAFEEIHRVQSAWKVPDDRLRDELRISISGNVIQAYRSFEGKFGPQIQGERHAGRYIKYTTEDLESLVLEFFEGSSASSSHSKRK